MTTDNPKFVYRYIAVHRLWQILSTACLYFLRNSKWDDPFEGFLVRRYCTSMKKDFARLNADKYFLCCTRKAERDHFWRNYTPNKDGVSITLNIDALRASDSRILCMAVEYPKVDIIQELLRQITTRKWALSDVTKLFFLKRLAFKDEDEYRLMIQDKSNEDDILAIHIEPRRIIKRIRFDPRMDPDTFNAHREFILDRFGNYDVVHSQLYNPDRSFREKLAQRTAAATP
jgi:hypothetical protein